MAFWTRNKKDKAAEERSGGFTYNGIFYPFSAGYGGVMPDTSSLTAGRPRLKGSLEAIVEQAQPHSVMSAAVLVRALLMSELQFVWADMANHETYTNDALSVLENPGGVGMNRPRLLMQLSQQADYTGNGILYHDAKRGRTRVLRADHCTQLLRSDADPKELEEIERLPPGERKEAQEGVLSAELAGWAYKSHRNAKPQLILPEFISHWAPEPHPASPFWGASWISSCITELLGDIQADRGVDGYFEHGMTPRLMHIMHEDTTPEEAAEWKTLTEDDHAGILQGSRNLYAGGVKDIKVVGTTLKDLGLDAYRGQLETRIAVRSRVPAAILGIAEGNKGGAIAGNTYQPTRRMYADGWFTPHAKGLCAALEQIVPPPKPSNKHPRGAYLSFDPTRVMFLQEDVQDTANRVSTNAAAIRTLTDGGFTADSAVKAVTANDLTQLVHSGLTSVQLLEPGTNKKEGASDA